MASSWGWLIAFLSLPAAGVMSPHATTCRMYVTYMFSGTLTNELSMHLITGRYIHRKNNWPIRMFTNPFTSVGTIWSVAKPILHMVNNNWCRSIFWDLRTKLLARFRITNVRDGQHRSRLRGSQWLASNLTVQKTAKPYTLYSARMSPENTHTLYRGFNTRRYTVVHGFCFF